MITLSVNHSGFTAIFPINFDLPVPCLSTNIVQLLNFTFASNIFATAPTNVIIATDLGVDV